MKWKKRRLTKHTKAARFWRLRYDKSREKKKRRLKIYFTFMVFLTQSHLKKKGKKGMVFGFPFNFPSISIRVRRFSAVWVTQTCLSDSGRGQGFSWASILLRNTGQCLCAGKSWFKTLSSGRIEFDSNYHNFKWSVFLLPGLTWRFLWRNIHKIFLMVVLI